MATFSSVSTGNHAEADGERESRKPYICLCKPIAMPKAGESIACFCPLQLAFLKGEFEIS
jgi:hypothetical protein